MSKRTAKHSVSSRRTRGVDGSLNETLERLATRIGDRVGEILARRLSELVADRPAVRGRPSPQARCAREGCTRPVAAKGLCKSHYNLMLYHRRKSEKSARGGRRPRS